MIRTVNENVDRCFAKGNVIRTLDSSLWNNTSRRAVASLFNGRLDPVAIIMPTGSLT